MNVQCNKFVGGFRYTLADALLTNCSGLSALAYTTLI